MKLPPRIPKCVEVEKVSSDNPELISKILAKEDVIKFLGMWPIGYRAINLIVFRNYYFYCSKNFRWRK